MPNNDLENQGWEQMRQLLDQHLPQEQPKKRPVFWWWSLGASMLAVTLVGYCSFRILEEGKVLHASRHEMNDHLAEKTKTQTPESTIHNSLNIKLDDAETMNSVKTTTPTYTNLPAKIDLAPAYHNQTENNLHVPLSINRDLESATQQNILLDEFGSEHRHPNEELVKLFSKPLNPEPLAIESPKTYLPSNHKNTKLNSCYIGSQIAYTFSDGYWTGLELGLSMPIGKRWNFLAQAQYGIGWVILPKLDEPFTATATTTPSNSVTNNTNFPGADVSFVRDASSPFSAATPSNQSILAHQIGVAIGIQFKLSKHWHTNVMANSSLLLQNQNERAVWAIGAQTELGYAITHRFSINAQYKVHKPLGTENYPLLNAIGLGLRLKL